MASPGVGVLLHLINEAAADADEADHNDDDLVRRRREEDDEMEAQPLHSLGL